MFMFYDGFFLNLCVLIASLFVYKEVLKQSSIEIKTTNTVKAVVQGLSGGLLAAILMRYSIETGINSMIDLRIIPLMMIVLYGNWLSSSITAFLIIVIRFIWSTGIQSYANIIFILVSYLLFNYCFRKIKNRRISIIVMLILSNIVYTILTILLPGNQYFNSPLVINYWVICIVGGIIAVYIVDHINEKESIFKENKDYALTDPLTGLNNVRSFDLAFNKAKNKLEHSNQAISLMLLDIDGFKQVNDTYGHLEGDAVLKKLATILKMSQSPGDVVSRNGGEEFTMLLYDCNLEEVYKRAESLRKVVESSYFVINNEMKSIYITISIGVTTYNETSKNIDQLYEHADQALYAAKKSGRNKVCSYERTQSLDD